MLISLLLLCACLQAAPNKAKITVTGTLVRVAAIGGESTGWSIESAAPIPVMGKEVHSIEVECNDAGKLSRLENKRVKASGKMVERREVETGRRSILKISKLKETEQQQ